MSADVRVAVFVKTPGVTPSKTRLGKSIGQARAEELYLHLLAVCRDWMAKLHGQLVDGQRIETLWAVAEDQHVGDWQDYPAIGQGGGGLAERLHRVYDECRRGGAAVMLVGADCPHLNQAVIIHALAELEGCDFVLGPAVDGGFYLLAGNQSISLAEWQSVPYSTEKTAATLIKVLKSQGHVVTMLSPLHDVDEVEDLEVLSRALQGKEVYGNLAKLRQWLASTARSR